MCSASLPAIFLYSFKVFLMKVYLGGDLSFWKIYVIIVGINNAYTGIESCCCAPSLLALVNVIKQ